MGSLMTKSREGEEEGEDGEETEKGVDEDEDLCP